MQHLWQAHYQILLIIWLKEFTKIKCKNEHFDKKCKTLALNRNIVIAFLNTQTLNTIYYFTYVYVAIKITKKNDKILNKRFGNTYKLSNNNINKFILLLQKGGYPYEYMDELEKFNETSLSEKKVFKVT